LVDVGTTVKIFYPGMKFFVVSDVQWSVVKPPDGGG
jgi:hypothetical protein